MLLLQYLLIDWDKLRYEDEMATKIIYSIIGSVLIVLAIFSGFSIEWAFDKDHTKLSSDGEVLARTRWSVEAERTSFLLDSWYDINVKCPNVLDIGGHISSTGKSCMYPEDYYEQLSRSLIRTTITKEEPTVTKLTPYYKYGTRGAYAGKVKEVFTFIETDMEKEFPESYDVNWKPTDTRNYQLIWRVWDLKELDLPDGDYSACSYKFGKVSIDLKDECSRLEKAEVKGDRIWFYFLPSRGEQDYSVSLVDPPPIVPSQVEGNLVAFWRLDGDPSNSSNAIDSSGNEHNGTIVGATLITEGRIRGAYSFDGINDRIDIPYTNIGTDITFSMWINLDNNALSNTFSFMHTLIRTSPTELSFWADDAISAKIATFNFATKTWYHLVITQNSDKNYVFYIDNVVIDSGVHFAVINTTDGSNHIAGYSGIYNFNGTIDEVSIYNRALTAEEVQKLYLGSRIIVNSGGNLTINSGGNLTFYS